MHKYRIESTRLQNLDYRSAGMYFLNNYSQNREHYFGEIKDGIMQLSPVGVIADLLWYEIKNHAQNIEQGEYFYAYPAGPNHVHGILILNDNDIETDTVETVHALSLQSESEQTIGQKRFQNIGKNSISSIIGSYKSAVTKHARRLGYDFARQTRFYDHIICNDESFRKITEYIMKNYGNWRDDKFYK